MAGVHGLSPALTSFVGREAAVDEVSGLLADCRLLTVTGPGGVGKTRLAGEVARKMAARFADGVWLVELAAVLARQQLLLVLDNCEHVIEAVAGLCGALLPAADDVRVLATSREPVGVSGETRYRTP